VTCAHVPRQGIHREPWLGLREGLVSVLTLSVARPDPAKLEAEAAAEGSAGILCVLEHLPLNEIKDAVAAGAQLTTDFLTNLICAAVIAGLGLASDSPVMVVASMLISPMMGPIMAICYGLALRPVQTAYTRKVVRGKDSELESPDSWLVNLFGPTRARRLAEGRGIGVTEVARQLRDTARNMLIEGGVAAEQQKKEVLAVLGKKERLQQGDFALHNDHLRCR
jgi:hypothetical protein